METPNTNLEDWREEITEGTETLKVKDGDIVEIVFANEGVKKSSADYGNSIAFSVILTKCNGDIISDTEPKTFYVKSNNFDLLNQIKVLGKLTGVKAKLSRTGSTKSNTRYKIIKI